MEARDYRRIARENLAGNWALSIGVAAVAWLLGGLLVGSGFLPELEFSTTLRENMSYQVSEDFSINFGGSNPLGLVGFIIGGVIQLGYAQYLLKQYKKTDFQFQDLFSQFNRFGQGFAQAFLRGLYTFLWSLLLIIPGIVKSYAYAMTPFIIAENPNLTASEAITASKEMMDGRKGELFWLDLTFFGWDLLAILTLNIGHIALNPYKNAAHAAFYQEICKTRGI